MILVDGSLIGCTVARRLAAAAQPDQAAENCIAQKDGSCLAASPIADPEPANPRALPAPAACAGAAAIKAQLGRHCDRWKGVFREQCRRAVPRMAAELARTCRPSAVAAAAAVAAVEAAAAAAAFLASEPTIRALRRKGAVPTPRGPGSNAAIAALARVR